MFRILKLKHIWTAAVKDARGSEGITISIKEANETFVQLKPNGKRNQLVKAE